MVKRVNSILNGNTESSQIDRQAKFIYRWRYGKVKILFLKILKLKESTVDIETYLS